MVEYFLTQKLQNQTDDQYNKIINCSDHGSIYNINDTHSYCDCDIAFFQIYCSVSGQDSWGKGWILFQIIFTAIYFIIAGFTWMHLIKNILKVYKIYILRNTEVSGN